MDLNFFVERFWTIINYQSSFILLNKEKKYYKRYASKLGYDLICKWDLLNKDVGSALKYIDIFENREKRRVKNSFLVKPRSIISHVCKDARDVVNSMKRYEGTYN